MVNAPPQRVDLPRFRAHRERILQLAELFGASNVRVFGSLARGESRPDSDVDILVDFAPSHTLLEWSSFWQELERTLGAPVDLAVASDLRPEVRIAVLREAIPL